VIFGRGQSQGSAPRTGSQDELVDRLLYADELAQRLVLLEALQSGQLRKSEAGDLLRLVERLESVAGGKS